MAISPVTARVELDCAAVRIVVDEPLQLTAEGITDPTVPMYAVIHEDGVPVNERWTTLAFLAAVAEGAAAAIAEAQ